jgi:hypothetical protein
LLNPIPWLVTVLHLLDGAPVPIAPRGLTLSARSCEPCHAAIVAEWRQSAHASAFDNSLFRASFRDEPRAWCVSCHAPLRQRDEGVGCASCHVRDGAILAPRPATAEAARAHPIVVEPRLSAELCAGCHQFNWPITTEPLRYGPHPMQNTVAEWRKSGSNRSCVDCHMAQGHRMPGGHDVAFVKGALAVTVAPRPHGRVQVALRSRAIGHAAPTGDPFRRLVVQLCAFPSCATPLREVFFGRRLDPAHDGKLRVDTTVPAGGARQLEVPAPDGARYWRLVYRYAAIGTNRDLDDDEREQEIATGTIGGGS